MGWVRDALPGPSALHVPSKNAANAPVSRTNLGAGRGVAAGTELAPGRSASAQPATAGLQLLFGRGLCGLIAGEQCNGCFFAKRGLSFGEKVLLLFIDMLLDQREQSFEG